MPPVVAVVGEAEQHEPMAEQPSGAAPVEEREAMHEHPDEEGGRSSRPGVLVHPRAVPMGLLGRGFTSER
jgi:hypothetical protein